MYISSTFTWNHFLACWQMGIFLYSAVWCYLKVLATPWILEFSIQRVRYFKWGTVRQFTSRGIKTTRTWRLRLSISINKNRIFLEVSTLTSGNSDASWGRLKNSISSESSYLLSWTIKWLWAWQRFYIPPQDLKVLILLKNRSSSGFMWK